MGHNSTEYIYTSVEAVKLAFADRDKYLCDVNFLPIPYAGLLSKDYARQRRRLIDPEHASLEFRPGEADKYAPGFKRIERPTDYTLPPSGKIRRMLRAFPVAPQSSEDNGDTSYIAVVDKDRNVVSFTPSLHTSFGTNVVMGRLGFSFNCRGDYFSLVPGHANALEPGKRPRTTLQSTLVLRDGRPVIVLGSPGGDAQCLSTMQTLLNMVEFGMNIQQAIEAPTWSTRSFPMSDFPHTMYPGELSVEQRIPVPVRRALEKKGHRVYLSAPWSLGANCGIVINAQTGVLSAGADPRTDAYALAW